MQASTDLASRLANLVHPERLVSLNRNASS